MSDKIFEPTLVNDESYKDLSSYNLEALFVLAILGGITPIIVKSLKNAKLLKLEVGQRKRMGILALTLWLCEFVLFGICGHFNNFYAAVNVALFSRLVSLGLYTYFYMMMRPKYKVVKFFNGELEPTIPTVIGWTIAGYNIELLMVLVASFIISLF
jgi:hypothetical protein